MWTEPFFSQGGVLEKMQMNQTSLPGPFSDVYYFGMRTATCVTAGYYDIQLFIF